MGLFLVGDQPTLLEAIDAQSLSANQLAEAEWVHNWIEKNFPILFGQFNIELIGHEVNITGSGSEGYLDFLGVDLSTGNTVIIEAKRDDFDPRKLIGQAVEYAAGISRFSKEKLNQIYQEYINSQEETLENVIIQKSGNPALLNKSQSIILVVQSSYLNQGSMLRLKSACLYLRETGLDINILELKWFKKEAAPKAPEKGDIVEAEFLWNIEEVKKPPGVLTPLQESSFLLDKTDTAIQLYNFVVKLIDSQRVKYSRRTGAKWITFYGKKPKAFLVVQFEDNQIKLRLRLGDSYDHKIVERLSDNYDKLAASDKFLHQVTVNSCNQKDDLIKVIMDSYNYNNP